jgi:RecA/RadA recombinase
MAKKLETPETDNDMSKALLETHLKDTKDTHFNFVITKQVVIPSGSLKLDSYLKVKSGTVIRMGGPAEVGKTSQSMLFADNYMKTLPKSKTIYINAEFKFGEEIQKRTGLTFVTDPKLWDYGTVFILNSNCYDTICDILASQYRQIHEDGGHLCTIVDSVDMLRLKSSFGGSISDSKKPAGVNYLTKEMFRQLSGYINHYNGLLIMITQYAATFKIDKYEKDVPNLMEGNQTHALNHQASYALYYQPRRQSHYILENPEEKIDPVKNKILGVNAYIDIRKSSSDETGYKLEVPIRKGKIGSAIWVEKELFDSLFLYQLVTRKGAWINLSDTIVKWAEEAKVEIKSAHQGLEKFSEYFEQNPKILAWLVEKIRLWHS